jgi:hypothetical protein
MTILNPLLGEKLDRIRYPLTLQGMFFPFHQAKKQESRHENTHTQESKDNYFRTQKGSFRHIKIAFLLRHFAHEPVLVREAQW